MPLRTSPIVHRTTSRLLDQMHREQAVRVHSTTAKQRELPRMRPYAEQLAYERGDI